VKQKKQRKFKKSRFFGFCKKICSLFLRPAKVVYEDESDKPKQAIFLTNHGIKPLLGIIRHELTMPKDVPFVTIGTHELCNPYFKRLKYGYTIHYRLRLGWGKIRAFFATAFIAIFLGPLYKMARVIPSYRDVRSTRTVKNATDALNQNHSILLYPENLEHLYNNVFLEFLPGFVFLAQYYYKKTGKDIPVVPCYFSYQLNRFIMGKPMSVIELLESGKTRAEVADIFRIKVNNLYTKYIQPTIAEKEAKFAKYNKA